MDKRTAALTLLSIESLGPRRGLILVSKFDKPADIFNASYRELKSIKGITSKLARNIVKGGDQDFVEEQKTLLDRSPFDVITIFDDEYPENLYNIYDPPLVLYKHGDFVDADHDAIAFVGTRKCTKYGKQVTETLVKELVRRKITIVSGFARGIDTTAHRTALKNSGRTIAALGNGVDKVYPPENRELRTELVKNGVYCSEFALGTRPDAQNFPRRNRIISGLSLGTVVVEAGQKSGALLTSNYSINQNRETFAVPGRITSRTSKGTNQLIKQGAKPVLSVEDILEEIENLRKYPEKERQLKIEFNFTSDEQKIYDSLTFDPLHIDELSDKTGYDTHEALSTLLNLELKGAVKQFSGKMFAKIGNFQ
ncbi:MAG TPA: DNA-processing protein DprA [bacterium]|nr:DNA-processing protein DprA [bacterium]